VVGCANEKKNSTKKKKIIHTFFPPPPPPYGNLTASDIYILVNERKVMSDKLEET